MSSTASIIIDSFGGHGAVAEITGVDEKAVRAWKSAGIPARLWPLLVRIADRRGIPGVTFEALGAPLEEGKAASPRRRRPTTDAAQAAA